MEQLKLLKEDISATKEFFENYSAKFLKNKDEETKGAMVLKKEHSLKVAQLSCKIATNLQLEEEEIILAEIIGLLHDIGRFTQFEKYQTFDDLKSEDHAAMGLALLNEQVFFSSFSEEIQKNISGAISNHNKDGISLKEDKQVVLYSKILRDADKLDIWDACVVNLLRNGKFRLESISWNLPHTGIVSDSVIRNIEQQKQVRKKDTQSINDFKLMLMSMVFDLNFRISFQLLNEKQMIKKLYDSLPKKDVVIDAYREIRLFIENKFVE